MHPNDACSFVLIILFLTESLRIIDKRNMTQLTYKHCVYPNIGLYLYVVCKQPCLLTHIHEKLRTLLQIPLAGFAHYASLQTRGVHSCLFAALPAGKELYRSFSGVFGRFGSSGLSAPASDSTTERPKVSNYCEAYLTNAALCLLLP